jgi:hypothetical protein
MFRYSALAALCVVAGATSAGELHQMNGGSLDVGTFRGNVYYTESNGAYRVVTTIAAGEAGSPVRFEVTLAEGQSMTISAPRGLNEPSDALELSHVGDRLLVMPVVPGPELVSAGQ